MSFGRFTRTHAVVFLAVWLPWTVLVALIVHGGLDRGPDHNGRVLLTTLLSFTGPMVGAISRGCQSCCLQASLALLPYAGGCLMAGCVVQWLPLPRHTASDVLRVLAWVTGWLAWFGSGVLSFGHALG
jgi:hypothetical protein